MLVSPFVVKHTYWAYNHTYIIPFVLLTRRWSSCRHYYHLSRSMHMTSLCDKPLQSQSSRNSVLSPSIVGSPIACKLNYMFYTDEFLLWWHLLSIINHDSHFQTINHWHVPFNPRTKERNRSEVKKRISKSIDTVDSFYDTRCRPTQGSVQHGCPCLAHDYRHNKDDERSGKLRSRVIAAWSGWVGYKWIGHEEKHNKD